MPAEKIDIPFLATIDWGKSAERRKYLDDLAKKNKYKLGQDVTAKDYLPTTFPNFYIPAGSNGKVMQVFGHETYEVRFTIYEDQHMTVGCFGNTLK